MSSELIFFKQIDIAGGTQFRDNVNQDVVRQYKDDMMNGDQFPPMQTVFDGNMYWLWDGFHRYFALKSIGVEQVEVECRSGTQEDAQDLGLSANAIHGYNRDNITKRKQVETALSMQRHQDKSDRDIAKLCKVSIPFVSGIRRPEIKEKQTRNAAKHFDKKIKNDVVENFNTGTVINYTSEQNSENKLHLLAEDFGPTADELKASELAIQADMETLYMLLESDEPLKIAHEEIKRLKLINGQLELRLHGLMNERNECVKLNKKQQVQLDSIRRKRG